MRRKGTEGISSIVEVMTGRSGRFSRWKSLGIRRTGDQSGRGRRARLTLEEEDVTAGGRVGGSSPKEKLEEYKKCTCKWLTTCCKEGRLASHSGLSTYSGTLFLHSVDDVLGYVN